MTTQVLVKREIILDGLNCAHCAEVINEKVNNLEEVESANLNFINKILTLNIKPSYNQENVKEKVIKIIDD
ncbi:MAG: cation transporter, partial [Paraclostridium sordellii]